MAFTLSNELKQYTTKVLNSALFV